MKISSSMVFDTKALCSDSETEGESGMVEWVVAFVPANTILLALNMKF